MCTKKNSVFLTKSGQLFAAGNYSQEKSQRAQQIKDDLRKCSDDFTEEKKEKGGKGGGKKKGKGKQ